MYYHPDADIFPEASGPAKLLVDQHKAEQPLKLYAAWFCPFVQRVWLALEEKHIPYEYIEVNPYNKPTSLISLNPRGLVPTLSCPSQEGPKALYESIVVLEYLEEAYPSHEPRFLPRDPYERARARVWMDYVTSRIIPSFHRFLQYQPAKSTSDAEKMAGLRKVRNDFIGHLRAWIKEMHADGPFFLGTKLGLPDLVLAPWAVRLWVFDEFKGGVGIPPRGAGDPDEDIWNRWRTWLAAIVARPSVQNTTSQHDHYIPIYKRYSDNTAQSELAKATRSGGGVP